MSGAITPAAVAEEEASRSERKAGPIIEALWRRASEIAREEVDRTMKRIGADREVEEHLAAMAEALVSELLRPPSTRLRKVSADGRGGERLVAAAMEMFGLSLEGAPARSKVAGQVAPAPADDELEDALAQARSPGARARTSGRLVSRTPARRRAG